MASSCPRKQVRSPYSSHVRAFTQKPRSISQIGNPHLTQPIKSLGELSSSQVKAYHLASASHARQSADRHVGGWRAALSPKDSWGVWRRLGKMIEKNVGLLISRFFPFDVSFQLQRENG